MSERGHATGSSLTDMMASLFAIFVLLFVVAQNNRGAGAKSARERLIKQLQGELPAAGIESANIMGDPTDPYTVLIVLPDSVLFPRGSAVMIEAGRQVVRRFTPRLASILCSTTTPPDAKKEQPWRIDRVVVEGHTDTTWSKDATRAERRKRNLVLSQQRAMNYVQESVDTLVAGSGPIDCFLPLVSASGRGQEELRPDAPDDGPAQRRVVLRLRLASEQDRGKN